ncbi:MAG: HAMP domain-containing sensor histidine kinase [Elusimicrobiaceae bacterium]|jgi:signal transduction histidine kinase
MDLPLLILILVVGGVFIAVIFLSVFLFMGMASRMSMARRKNAQTQQMMQMMMQNVLMARSELSAKNKELEKVASRMALSNEELQRLNSMKTKFLSMVVHDVRNPLTSISGYGTLLSESVNNRDAKRYADNILNSAKHLNMLVGDLADVARIESGKFKMIFELIDLKEVIEEIGYEDLIIAQNRGIKLEGSLPEEPLNAMADKQRIKQVLSNFLGNALKFTPAGGAINLSAKRQGGHITVSVRDTGPGIHPSEQKLVFAKFYQSKYSKATDQKKGWGLGLAISTEIIKGHGGTLGVTSKGLGKGAEFWFSLPAK